MIGDELRNADRNGRQLIRADMFRDQDRKARHELCTKNLTDQDVIVQPIEDALWIELGVFRVSDVEHLLPRNEDVLEDRGGVEFVALRRHRMFRSVLRRGALTAENRHAWRVDRDRGEDDLLARDAGRSEEQTSELQSLMRIPYAGFSLT